MKGVWKKRNFLSTYPSLHCTNNLSVDVQSQKNVQAQIPYTSGPTLWIGQYIATTKNGQVIWKVNGNINSIPNTIALYFSIVLLIFLRFLGDGHFMLVFASMSLWSNTVFNLIIAYVLINAGWVLSELWNRPVNFIINMNSLHGFWSLASNEASWSRSILACQK